MPDPTGYGRIVRDAGGRLAAIVEQKDADADPRAITEINSGVYAFDGAVLAARSAAARQQQRPGRALPDRCRRHRPRPTAAGRHRTADDAAETEGVNDRVQLADLARRLNARLVRQAQLAGVTVQDPATTWIHADVTIGPDTVLLPGTSLEAGTVDRLRLP